MTSYKSPKKCSNHGPLQSRVVESEVNCPAHSNQNSQCQVTILWLLKVLWRSAKQLEKFLSFTMVKRKISYYICSLRSVLNPILHLLVSAQLCCIISIQSVTVWHKNSSFAKKISEVGKGHIRMTRLAYLVPCFILILTTPRIHTAHCGSRIISLKETLNI